MIRGVGIDSCCISEVERLMGVGNGAFVTHTFMPAEVEASQKVPSQAEYLATRFAVKEAVFKAVAHLAQNYQGFDFRCVETLNHPDGSPYVNVGEKLQAVLDEARVDRLLVSITTESDLATAIVVATWGEGLPEE